MFARAVLKYDLKNIPDLPKDATVVEVLFSAYYTIGDSGEEDDLCSLFVIEKQWESTETTWKQATKKVPWEQLDLDTKYFDPDLEDTVQYPGGGDRLFPCAATAPVADQDKPWETFTITKIMKKAIADPDGFHGLYLKPHAENTGRWYASSEAKEKDKRPKLTIKYIGTDIKSNTTPWLKPNGSIRVSTDPSIRIFVPFDQSFSVEIHDLQGKKYGIQKGIRKQWVDFSPLRLSTGLYLYVLRFKTGGPAQLSNLFWVK